MAPLGISLEKLLPVASGLGGGSSDAGAAFRLLRQTLDLPVADDRLEALAAALGSDGAACLWGAPAIAQGRGERLSAAPGLPALDAVLVNPRVPVSTAEVYRRFDRDGRFGDVTPPSAPEAFEDAMELAAWLATQRNDLEAPAIAVAPAVGRGAGDPGRRAGDPAGPGVGLRRHLFRALRQRHRGRDPGRTDRGHGAGLVGAALPPRRPLAGSELTSLSPGSGGEKTKTGGPEGPPFRRLIVWIVLSRARFRRGG